MSAVRRTTDPPSSNLFFILYCCFWVGKVEWIQNDVSKNFTGKYWSTFWSEKTAFIHFDTQYNWMPFCSYKNIITKLVLRKKFWHLFIYPHGISHRVNKVERNMQNVYPSTEWENVKDGIWNAKNKYRTFSPQDRKLFL